MGGIAIWLGLRDMARRTVTMPRIARYMETVFLIAYAWLTIAQGFGSQTDSPDRLAYGAS